VSGYEHKNITRYGKRSFLGGLQSSSTCNYTLRVGATAGGAIWQLHYSWQDFPRHGRSSPHQARSACLQHSLPGRHRRLRTITDLEARETAVTGIEELASIDSDADPDGWSVVSAGQVSRQMT